MRIRELLSSQSIALGAESANKKDIIEKMTVLMEASGNLTDRKQYLAGVLEREKKEQRESEKGLQFRMLRMLR